MHGYAYHYGIDRDYVSGLSITYSRNPRQHIWTFASGRGEKISQKYNCPCTSSVAQPPSYVGNNHFGNQLLGIVPPIPHIISMTHYGMEQGVSMIVVITPLNLGSIVS